MEVILLIIATTLAWIVCTAIDQIPNLGQLLVPSPWMVGAALVLLATWFIRD